MKYSKLKDNLNDFFLILSNCDNVDMKKVKKTFDYALKIKKQRDAYKEEFEGAMAIKYGICKNESNYITPQKQDDNIDHDLNYLT